MSRYWPSHWVHWGESVWTSHYQRSTKLKGCLVILTQLVNLTDRQTNWRMDGQRRAVKTEKYRLAQQRKLATVKLSINRINPHAGTWYNCPRVVFFLQNFTLLQTECECDSVLLHCHWITWASETRDGIIISTSRISFRVYKVNFFKSDKQSLPH